MKLNPYEILQSLAAIENFNLKHFGSQNENVSEIDKSHNLPSITENGDVEPEDENNVTLKPLRKHHFKRLDINIYNIRDIAHYVRILL